MIIREETTSDIENIWQLNSETFETDAEANLVNTLRNSGCHYLSLLAEVDNKVVGHILFTPVELSTSKDINIMGLAPMAVLSQYQNMGIGSKLVLAGLEQCRLQGYDAVVVLGHPGYYPRFGFVPSVKYGIRSEYDVADEVFMLLELTPGCLTNHKGIIRFDKAFEDV